MPGVISRRRQAHLGSRSCGAAAGALSVAPAGATTLTVGQNVASIITNGAANAVYYLAAGTHRLTAAIEAPVGIKLYGAPGAILSGSQLLTTFTTESVSSTTYNVATVVTLGFGTNSPDVVDPVLNYRATRSEMLYFDSVPLKHAPTLAAVTAGWFYFNETTSKVYFLDDPSGHVVEFTRVDTAFDWTPWSVPRPDNIVVQGVTIEKFASAAGIGAVRAGAGWRVNRNTIRLCFGVGIGIPGSCLVTNNVITNNGNEGYCMGYATVPYSGIVVSGNEISYNGEWSGVDPGWESGGGKLAITVDALVSSNYSHHNKGPGFWSDEECYGVLYEYNRAEYNKGPGIFHEISYACIIRYNRCAHNGEDKDRGWIWGANIQIANSEGSDIHHNYLENSGPWGQNMVASYQDRQNSALTVRYYVKNNSFHHNVVVARAAGHGLTAAAADFDGAAFWANTGGMNGNTFDYNEYHLSSLTTGDHFEWADVTRQWAYWSTTAGHEAHGTANTVLPP